MLPGLIPSTNDTLDSKGGTDSTNMGKPTKKTGSNYVYYRLYTTLGSFESNHPTYANDRFLGRIPSKSFAPPHTTASIKRSLCKFEGLSETNKSHLFLGLSSLTPEEDSAHLSLYSSSGPGLSEEDPFLLLVLSDKRSTNARRPEELPGRLDDGDTPYVHYRVYSSEGDERSKTSFVESDASLGRINTLLVAPPRTVGSLKACIAKMEGLVIPGHALYEDMELFEDMGSKTSMNGSHFLSFLGDTYPGSNEWDPVALVNAAFNVPVHERESISPLRSEAKPPEDIDKLHTLVAQYQIVSDPDPTFTQTARLFYMYDHGINKPAWLSTLSYNDMVCTNGIIVRRQSPSNQEFYGGYIVMNANNQRGFVLKECLEFIS